MQKTFILLLLLSASIIAGAQTSKTALGSIADACFVENKGQIRDQYGKPRKDIDFMLAQPGFSVSIGGGQLHYQFKKEHLSSSGTGLTASSPQTATGKLKTPARQGYGSSHMVDLQRLEVTFENANQNAPFVTEGEQPQRVNYYNSSADTSGTVVSSFRKITYKNIYPSIDWVIYLKGNELKYDFVIRPGGRASDIKIKYMGADSLFITHEGSLKITTSLGALTEEKPFTYDQETKQTIPSRFALNKNILSFNVSTCKHTMVIDPSVDWSTYFGGEIMETALGVSTDSIGNIYLTGTTNSTNYIATTGAYQTTLAGTTDAFLAKFDSSGQRLWVTYYGGWQSNGMLGSIETNSIVGASICNDLYGHVYLCGQTSSTISIATPGAYQPVFDPGSVVQGFLVKFNNNGQRLWGTYYGASAFAPMVNAVTCDPSGNVYIAGITDSSVSTSGALVSPGAHQTQFGGGSDGLLIKFDSAGSRLWATYYGGTGYEWINDIASDDAGNVYITGSLDAGTTNIATPGTFIDTHVNGVEGFVAKFNTNGVRLWGSYLKLKGLSLAADKFNHLYVSGTTGSQTDPLIYSPGAYQQYTSEPYNNAFLQLNQATGTRNWGTYYNGEEVELFPNSIACSKDGYIYFSGMTTSKGTILSHIIATPGSYQDTLNTPWGTINPEPDVFIARFDSTGKRKWATYYGGPGYDGAGAGVNMLCPKFVACGPKGEFYLAGVTTSNMNVATPGAYQSSINGQQDAFLTKFIPLDISLLDVIAPDSDTICSGNNAFAVSIKNKGLTACTDTLLVTYIYTGPVSGDKDTFFTEPILSGASDTLNLGMLNLTQQGIYEITVCLHYIKDDNDRDNDTIRHTIKVIAPPVADILSYQIGDTYYFSCTNTQSGDIFSWDFGDGQTSADAEPEHIYLPDDSSYLVVLTISNDCGSDTDSLLIGANSTGIHSFSGNGLIKVYPNPAKNQLSVSFPDYINLASYLIYDIRGNMVQSGLLPQNGIISLTGFEPQIYMLKLFENNGNVYLKKLVVSP